VLCRRELLRKRHVFGRVAGCAVGHGEAGEFQHLPPFRDDAHDEPPKFGAACYRAEIRAAVLRKSRLTVVPLITRTCFYRVAELLDNL
jgi:hypothetical protein